ncbi:serine protease Do [Rhizobium leguminosarum]|uniref:S1 family peptidase n=1 Tax=Rhizobium leguminosarum TaxID=384 RepID=UPI00161F11E7|nr:serine protease [Rhizobium leguminosarum]MBB5664722.1 serine protease Do [Rhizobium leguminosarum]
MRFYRFMSIAILAFAIVIVGGVAIAVPNTVQTTITNTIVQAVPTTSEDSAVKISVADGLGSGVHIGGGNILTAAHVVGDQKTVKIKTLAGTEDDAAVLWVNKDYDVALIHTDGNVSGSSELDCREPRFGEQLQAIGNPLGMEFIASFGRVAGTGRQTGPWKRVIVTDMTTVMGQSGGGVFANDGRVVGINVGVTLAPLKGKNWYGGDSYTPTMTGFGFVVPASVVCDLLARRAS